MIVYLITGSRSFEGNEDVPRDEDLVSGAKTFLFEELYDASKTDRVLIVAGEAAGPDTWAREFVESRAKTARILRCECKFEMEQYRCDGTAYQIALPKKWRWAQGRVKPLDRNTKLVDVAASMAKAHDVRVLAILDKRSRTGGTMDTVRKAKEAGLQGRVMAF